MWQKVNTFPEKFERIDPVNKKLMTMLVDGAVARFI